MKNFKVAPNAEKAHWEETLVRNAKTFNFSKRFNLQFLIKKAPVDRFNCESDTKAGPLAIKDFFEAKGHFNERFVLRKDLIEFNYAFCSYR